MSADSLLFLIYSYIDDDIQKVYHHIEIQFYFQTYDMNLF
jgi:hypothetical protein